MAKKLLYALFKTLHIALITVVFVTDNTAYAQTSLSSGDVVIVTINTGSDSGVDIIPLVDLERGTQLVLTNAGWKERSDEFEDEGFSFTYIANTFISRGTAIRLYGEFELDEEVDQVILYQRGQEKEVQEVLFGAFWNTNPQRRLDPQRIFRRNRAQTVPDKLKDAGAYLTFNDRGNHQYFIRNGASGSKKMLLDFATNVAYWRQHDTTPFPMFGTSFTLLTPPVIQFYQSRTSVDERGKKIVLDVEIFEHDGSPLTVVAMFDPVSSTIGEDEFTEEKQYLVDFSGLEGSGAFEIEFPIRNDEVFENTELAVFYLDSLSHGSYGDFRTHSAFVRDDDIPALEIVEVVSFPKQGILGDANRDGIRDISDDQYIIVQNKESIPVDLSDWKLTASRTRHNFDWEVVLEPDETITIFGGGNPDSTLFANQKVATASTGNLNLSDGGGRVRLINEKGKTVAEYRYPPVKEDILLSDPLVISSSSANTTSSSTPITSAAMASAVVSPEGELHIPFPAKTGWSYVSSEALGQAPTLQSKAFVWDERTGEFTQPSNDAQSEAQSYIVYIPDNEVEEEGVKKVEAEKFEDPESITLTLSATDRNGDEVLSGTEGLNHFSNPLSRPIFVQSLTGLLRDHLLGNDANIQVYTSVQSANGSISHIPLNEQSFIAPFAPFWLKLNVELAPENIAFDVNTLVDINAYEPIQTDEYETEGSLELNLLANSTRKSIVVDFARYEELSYDLDLNGVPELALGSESSSFYGMKENTSLSNINIPSNFETPIEIPLYVNVNEDCSCELRVADWDNLPLGARVKIRDIQESEEYELDKDWRQRFDFDYTPQEPVVDTPEFKATPNLRFILRILPEGYTDPEDETEIPSELELYQNFPNPFNPTTTIRFFLPEVSEVKLTIYNIVGQPIVVLAEGSFSQGEHERVWDASSYPSSIYISELVVGNKVLTRKMTLVK